MGLRLVAVALCVMVLAGCAKKGADAVPDEALDAIAIAAANEINAPVTSIFGVLKKADDTHAVLWPDLGVGFDSKTWPVNWWLYRHGYLELTGLSVSQGQPFALSKKATDVIAAGDQPWYDTSLDAPTKVDCTSETLPEGACEVQAAVKSSLTEAGKAAGAALPGPVDVTAYVLLGPDGWEVSGLTPVGTRSLHNVALDAILGPEAARGAQLEALEKELALQFAGGPDSPAFDRNQPLGAGLAPLPTPQPDTSIAPLPSIAPTAPETGPGGRQKL